MSLASNAIITAAEVAPFLKLDTDSDEYKASIETILETLIGAASGHIDTVCNNKFTNGDGSLLSDTYEFYGNGLSEKYMRYAPISGNIAVTDISYWDGTQWVALDSSYSISNDNELHKGILEFTDGNRFDRNTKWKVVYSHGYLRTNIPVDLKLACIKIVVLRYREHDGKLDGASSRSIGDQSTSYSFGDYPQYVKEILHDYKRYAQ